ncbi:MAG: hypothetical protein QOG53_2903 [Frankiales bacterium]|nr:hypothetical protein [Frankiales bacterium]
MLGSSTGLVRRAATVLALTLSMGTLALVTGMSPAHASSDESAFVSDINHARAQHGLSALKVSSQLTSVARRWSQHMASGGCGGGQSICHNDNLGSQVSGWQRIGENVGVGPNEDSIQNAFMNSSHHRANILDPKFTLVGVGTARGSDGRLYVTQDFETPMGGSSSSPPKKKTTTHHSTARTSSSSSAPTRSRPAVVAKPAAPRPAASPLALRLRSLTSKPGTANDPVSQALAYHSAMGMLAR